VLAETINGLYKTEVILVLGRLVPARGAAKFTHQLIGWHTGGWAEDFWPILTLSAVTMGQKSSVT
jgi:hypothetical protein